MSRAHAVTQLHTNQGWPNVRDQFSMPDYCTWKSKVLSQDEPPLGLRLALSQQRRVYIGAGGYKLAGWESFNEDELDVTNEHTFSQLFCPGEVQAFHSEHTFEHISKESTELAFQLFFQYLANGGYVRTAVPPYGPGHTQTPLDGQYGHVNFMTADEFVDLMEHIGYTDVKKLEWTDFETKTVHTTAWDFCEGPVIRSVQYDRRNQEFLRSKCNDLNTTYSEDGSFASSTLAENSFSERDINTHSAIIQGFKRL